MSTLTVYRDNNPANSILYTENAGQIQALLQEKGVRFERLQAALPDDVAGPDAVLAAYEEQMDRIAGEGGYVSLDVVAITPDYPQKTALRRQFMDEHTHSEDEVRFFVSGQGLFCLHIGSEIWQVLCEQGDLIAVPAHTPHWFDMGSEPSFTAIRIFNNPEGWIGTPTGSPIAGSFPCLA